MENHKLSDYALLKQLTQAFGPSGNEGEITRLISEQVRSSAVTVEIDPLGNLIVHKPGNGQKIMIACHMDEVGVIVTHIHEKGYLYFAPVGGVKDLLSKRVKFQNGCVGIISQENHTEDGKPSGRLYMDIGVRSEEEARTLIREGDMAVLVGEFIENEQSMISKALDNRIGCFLAIEVLKKIQSPDDLYFVFTVQEEVGARGAATVAHQIEPDLALIVDTTLSFDRPKEKNRTSINNGAAVKVMDRSIIVSPKIKNWMAEIAQKNEIPFQWEIITAGGTDSGPVHLTKGGIPTGGIAIPVRYLHSGNELASRYDLESAYALLYELLQNPYHPSL